VLNSGQCSCWENKNSSMVTAIPLLRIVNRIILIADSPKQPDQSFVKIPFFDT